MECRVASAERSSRLGQAQMTPDCAEQPLHGVRGCGHILESTFVEKVAADAQGSKHPTIMIVITATTVLVYYYY